MPTTNWRHRTAPQTFVTDTRPGADTFVYCKGCGEPLEGQPRHVKPRTVVTVMMCPSCIEIHGHTLVPKLGSPTFCYRCGTAEQVFVSDGHAPTTFRVCPRCTPDRAARYSAGDFEDPLIEADAE